MRNTNCSINFCFMLNRIAQISQNFKCTFFHRRRWQVNKFVKFLSRNLPKFTITKCFAFKFAKTSTNFIRQFVKQHLCRTDATLCRRTYYVLSIRFRNVLSNFFFPIFWLIQRQNVRIFIAGNHCACAICSCLCMSNKVKFHCLFSLSVSKATIVLSRFTIFFGFINYLTDLHTNFHS